MSPVPLTGNPDPPAAERRSSDYPKLEQERSNEEDSMKRELGIARSGLLSVL